MGSVQPYRVSSGRRYAVRYKKPDGTHAAKRGFLTKREALDYLAEKMASIGRGQFIDPSDSKIRLSELGGKWLRQQEAVLKPSSMHPLESSWRIHVNPRWGHIWINEIKHSHVRDWVAELSTQRGATTVIRAYGILAAVLDIAVRDRRLPDNPARGVKLPRKRPKRRVYLSHRQVEQLARHSIYPELVYFLAYTGLRWGEATGLRVRDLDTQRRRVHIQENAVMVNGTIHTGTPKTHASRSVPYPDFLDPVMISLTAGKHGDQLLFGDGDNHMKLPNSQKGWFIGAVGRAQASDPSLTRVTPHDLRHTAASLAISAGANVKAIQRMLGHASAAMTLDTYADLFDDDLDLVAQALNEARKSQLNPPRFPRVDLPANVQNEGL